MRRQDKGFTILELMVTLAVLAILMGVAVPAFQQASLNASLSSYANKLSASAMLARGEAIKRYAVVRLCKSTNGTSCDTSASNWAVGWIVFVDSNNNGSVDSGETILVKEGAANTNFRFTGSVNNIAFQPSGVGGTAATITVCRYKPSPGYMEKVVSIAATGRPSVALTQNKACP